MRLPGPVARCYPAANHRSRTSAWARTAQPISRPQPRVRSLSIAKARRRRAGGARPDPDLCPGRVSAIGAAAGRARDWGRRDHLDRSFRLVHSGRHERRTAVGGPPCRGRPVHLGHPLPPGSAGSDHRLVRIDDGSRERRIRSGRDSRDPCVAVVECRLHGPDARPDQRLADRDLLHDRHCQGRT